MSTFSSIHADAIRAAEERGEARGRTQEWARSARITMAAVATAKDTQSAWALMRLLHALGNGDAT